MLKVKQDFDLDVDPCSANLCNAILRRVGDLPGVRTTAPDATKLMNFLVSSWVSGVLDDDRIELPETNELLGYVNHWLTQKYELEILEDEGLIIIEDKTLFDEPEDY